MEINYNQKHLTRPVTNKYANRIVQKPTADAIDSVVAENAPQSFYERLSGLVFCIKWIFLPLLLLWSIITEFGFFGTEFFGMSQSVAIAGLGAGVLIAIIEVGKYATGKLMVKFLVHGWLKDGFHYKIIFIPLSLFCVMLFGASFYTSINGAGRGSENLRAMTTKVKHDLINIDAIKAEFATELLPYQATVAKAQKTTWKGSMTKEAVKLAKSQAPIIQGIQARKDSTLLAAQKQNAAKLEEEKAKGQNFGLWLKGFGGLGELLQLVCYTLLGIYYRFSYLELPEEGEEVEEAAAQVETEVQAPTARSLRQELYPNERAASNHAIVPASSRQIGFRYGQQPKPTALPAIPVPVQKEVAPAEQDSAVQTCTTVYKDLFTVSHISKNSRKEVRYGFDILKSRIKDYEAKRGQYEGPEKRDQYETYDKGLKYWKSKMAELLTLWAENGISQQEAYKDKYQKGLTLI